MSTSKDPDPALAMAPPYRYSPLTEQDGIRIVNLLPAVDPNSELVCELQHHRLSEAAGRYTALSYVWGSEDDSKFISLDGRRLSIRATLYAALFHLRRRDLSFPLWIDALCIDQANVNERNHQVGQMRDIFACAGETVVYLGSLDGNTSLAAWNYLERKSTCAINDEGHLDPSQPAIIDSLTDFRGDLHDVFVDVLDRPWFLRAWTYQEAVVSENLVMRCGKRGIKWDDFCDIVLNEDRVHDQYGYSLHLAKRAWAARDVYHARLEYLHSHGSHHDSKVVYDFGTRTDIHIVKDLALTSRWQGARGKGKGNVVIDYFKEKWKERKETASRAPHIGARRFTQARDRHTTRALAGSPANTATHILTTLTGSRRRQASDPRDKIFSAFGVSTGLDFKSGLFAVDYSNSWQEVYTSFARNYLRKTNNYDILSEVDSGPDYLWIRYRELDVRYVDEGPFDSQIRQARWSSESPGLGTLATWVPDWSYEHYSKPTILSALEPPLRRVPADMEWIGPSLDLAPRGAVLGKVTKTACTPILSIDEELFESIRKEHEKAPVQLYLEIMLIWDYMFHLSSKASSEYCAWSADQDQSWKHKNLTLNDFFQSISKGAQPAIGSIEHHFLARFRRTARTVDGSSLGAMRVDDPDSIVDTRSIALYTKRGTWHNLDPDYHTESLALVPRAARCGDLIVRFDGGRVPFVVRPLAQEEPVRPQPLKEVNCFFIGECLTNDYDEYEESQGDTRFVLR